MASNWGAGVVRIGTRQDRKQERPRCKGEGLPCSASGASSAGPSFELFACLSLLGYAAVARRGVVVS